MSSSPESDVNSRPPPFLLKVFYRYGQYFRLDEFAAPSLPTHVSIYTHPDCTLMDLAMGLAIADSSILPYPNVGTRLAFQLVCPDLRGTNAVNSSQPRFAVKELGSIVIGQGILRADELAEAEIPAAADRDNGKTLRDAHFVVGDYVSCAILPPLPDGTVAPASNARRESFASARDARSGHGHGHRGGFSAFEDSSRRGGGGGGRGGRDGWKNGGVPMGEWRRGEQLPDGPPGRTRGRGRW
jgi:histone deacetylase complex subunit SAP18